MILAPTDENFDPARWLFAFAMIWRYFGLNEAEVKQMTMKEFQDRLDTIEEIIDQESGGGSSSNFDSIDTDNMTAEQVVSVAGAMGIKVNKDGSR